MISYTDRPLHTERCSVALRGGWPLRTYRICTYYMLGGLIEFLQTQIGQSVTGLIIFFLFISFSIYMFV